VSVVVRWLVTREGEMSKATLFRLAILLVPMVQISCVHSEHPLADPETCAFDERLVGQWKKVGQDGSEFVFIGRPRDIKNRPDGMMVLNDVSLSSEKHELFWNPTATYFFVTRVGNDEYLQTFILSGKYPNESDWKKVTVKNYIFAKFKITDDRLTLWIIGQEATATAVKGGKLKGGVKKADLGEWIVLNEDSEGLRRYLKQGGNTTLFPDSTKLSFVRVR
jgi:hypothetical protein